MTNEQRAAIILAYLDLVALCQLDVDDHNFRQKYDEIQAMMFDSIKDLDKAFNLPFNVEHV